VAVVLLTSSPATAPTTIPPGASPRDLCADSGRRAGPAVVSSCWVPTAIAASTPSGPRCRGGLYGRRPPGGPLWPLLPGRPPPRTCWSNPIVMPPVASRLPFFSPTRARGGLAHTLSLGEAVLGAGGRHRPPRGPGDPAEGPSGTPSHTIVAAPPSADTLEDRVFASFDTLETGLADLCPPGRRRRFHAQDCIAARPPAPRDGHSLTVPCPTRSWCHRPPRRRLHTPARIECQQRASSPRPVLVVIEHWRELLAADYASTHGRRNGRRPRPVRHRAPTARSHGFPGPGGAGPTRSWS